MNEIHDFGTPRNLYEKLRRDSNKLDIEVSGDNVFNFISTAFHLQHWIKNSPLMSSEVVKRILRRIGTDEYVKHCQNIAQAKEHFKVEIDNNDNAVISVGDKKIDIDEFRSEIVALYGTYFELK
jgi:hypothetical protein